MEGTTLDMEALETRAKLQVKVHRALLRHQLIMWGNALPVAYLFALLMMAIWVLVMYLGGGLLMIRWSQALLGIGAPQIVWLNAVAYAGFKLASLLLLLCPGLGLRICGSAMKP